MTSLAENLGTEMTYFYSIGRPRALFVCLTYLVFFNCCFYNSTDLDCTDFRRIRDADNDGLLYDRISTLVREGEGYYKAAARTLSPRGYQTDSIFNIRTPVYAWIFGRVPSPLFGWGALFLLLTVATAAGSSIVRERGGVGRQASFAIMMILSYIWITYYNKIFFLEIWCGLLIWISLCLLCQGRAFSGHTLAALALAVRELALPYCLVCFSASVLKKKKRLTFFWTVVFAVFLSGIALHVRNVHDHFRLNSGSGAFSWVAFGGLPFLLSSCRLNYVLSGLPSWCTSVYLTLSLLGLLGWRSPRALMIRTTAMTYLLLFLVVGKPFNYYWGWLLMPSLIAGVVKSPDALRDILQSLRLADDQSMHPVEM